MPEPNTSSTPLHTADVAARAGVHKDTLLRWLRDNTVPEPPRDARGWRVFSEEEADAVVSFARARVAGSMTEGPLARVLGPEIGRLEKLDWDFADAHTNYLTHGLHPYPAKFIPQIPNALIQELSSVGERVGDIFCGSGTTLVEAMLLKRHAVGIDANPLAALISRAKITRLVRGDTELLHHLAQRAEDLGSSIAMQQENLLFDFAPFKSSAWRPEDHETLDFWFLPFVIEELAELRAWCDELPSESARDLALAAFSSIIVAVSKQDSDTRYTRREKGTKPGDAMRRFSKAVLDALHGAIEFTEIVEPRFQGNVLAADLLDKPDPGPLDLVVCSPPYPNAYSYHLYHRSRMQWLGMDQPNFKKQEIGSHRKYSRKGPNGATADTFRNEMSRIFGWLARHLKVGGYACFVVGNSTIRGDVVDNCTLLSKAAAPHGLIEVTRLDRRLNPTKKAFNPAIGKISKEQILVLRRSG